MDAQKRIAEIISMVLSAILIAFFAFTILIFFESPPSSALFLIITSFFGSIFPIAILLYLENRGIIPDIYASKRSTRTKPFIGAVISYLIGFIFLLFFKAPQSVIALMACYFINSLIMMTISKVWKISIHVSGISGPATFLVQQLGIMMLPFFFLILPVAWARLKLGAHNLSQIMMGALLPIGLVYIQLTIFSFFNDIGIFFSL
jgi:membrane-associated phospholipid phosphatase